MGCCCSQPTHDDLPPGQLYPGQGTGAARAVDPYGRPAMPPPPPGYMYGQPAAEDRNENMALGAIGGAYVGGILMGGGLGGGQEVMGGFHAGPKMGF